MNETLTILQHQVQSNIKHGHVLNTNITSCDCFEGFVGSQHISNASKANLREETFDILAHCNPHNATCNDETTHLVVGYVQSGKTMSFTALTALAHDNGYRLIIFLAGSKLNLLNQTSDRLTKDLIENASGKSPFKIYNDPTDDDLETIVGHLHLASQPTVLIPILKHHAHLDNLTKIVRSDDFITAMQGETTLIIDDEADQASLNGYGRKNSEKQEQEATATYNSILKLRAALPGNTYVQYTATPQANILISMQDLLSPQSHTLLTPGEGYIGGKLFFGQGKNHDLFNGNLILTIPDQQVFHARRNPLRKMPPSLTDALMLHILAVAIVVFWKRDATFLSMMVHPDTRKTNNLKFKRWIDRTLTNWRKYFEEPDGQEDKEDMLSRFRGLFPEAVKNYEDSEKPSFEDLLPFLHDILNDKKVYLVTSDKEAQTKIDWKKYSMHILVGAEMLNRGFTIENLATTYMPRYSVGATNADTIQQRCRFFGYKRDYIRSCRVFLPKISQQNYLDYIEHEEELRITLAKCDSLEAAERQILLSPSMRPTRQNVLPVSVVNTKLKGQQPMSAFESEATIRHNDKVVEEFLAKHETDFTKKYEYNTLDRTHRALDMCIDEAIEFLAAFKFGNYPSASQKSATIRYLRYLSSPENPVLNRVHFVQMAYASVPRERSFNYETKQIFHSMLFAGPSSATDSTYYPGDAKIVDNDTITIQLHHIKFKPTQIGFPQTAYTLAINYPERLATSYCSNEGNGEDEDEDDDVE